MDFDASAQVDALAKLPPEPPKPAERSAWGWVPRAITSGAGKVGAAIVEGVAAISPDEKDIARNPGSTAISSQALDSVARSARDFERSLRPDPATASTAEQVVFGLTSGLTEAAAGAVIAGPMGAAAALGVGEGAVLTDDLQRQGVDDKTARLAGAVGGVVNAASVMLPMAGPTLKATAALYLLGGPAGFMAQQAATRAILENADYSEIGAQFDPFDPVGLALSALIPLPFAAHGAMRIRKASSVDTSAGRVKESGADATGKPEVAPVPAPMSTSADTIVKPKTDIPKVSPEAVDAAMVHNLTLLRDAQEAVPPVTRAAEVMRGPVTENPNFKAWFGDSKVVDESGKPMVVYHGTSSDFDAFNTARGGDGTVGKAIYTTPDPQYAQQFADGAFTKTGTNPAIVPLYLRAKSILDFSELVTEEDVRRLASVGAVREDFSLGAPITHREMWEFLSASKGVQPAANMLRSAGWDAVRFLKPSGEETIAVFEPTQVKSAIGNSGRFDPTSASLTDPPPADAAPARPAADATKPAPAPDFGPLTAAVTQARDLIKTHGKAIDQYLATNEVPPEVNNLLIGLSEAGKDPRRVAAFLDLVARQQQDGSKSATDATADAVDGMRTLTDEQLTGTEPDALKPAIDPLMQSISDRVAAVHLAAPDMVVGLDASGNPITVADEIARIRKEAFEGTETELGAADADLVNVAANCALSLGA